jgi:4-hydroxy-2-oxoheptanedioate aldolase
MTKRNSRLRERLSESSTLVGLTHVRPNPGLVEVAGACGYGFLILDEQRGVFSEPQFLESLRTLVSAADILSMVRVSGHDTKSIARYLEFAPDAVVVPQVSTADEARTLASVVRSTDSTSLIVILESLRAAQHAEEILSVDGVDGAFVGPVNLSTDLGHPRDYAHPTFAQALTGIERAAAATGKVLGTVPTDVFPLQALVPRGHRLFIVGTDQSLLREALESHVTRIRAERYKETRLQES